MSLPRVRPRRLVPGLPPACGAHDPVSENARTCAHRCGGHRVCACGGRSPPCSCHGHLRHRGSAIDDAGHAFSNCHRERGRGRCGRCPCCAYPCCASHDYGRPACQANYARAIGSENVEHCGGPLQPAPPLPSSLIARRASGYRRQCHGKCCSAGGSTLGGSSDRSPLTATWESWRLAAWQQRSSYSQCASVLRPSRVSVLVSPPALAALAVRARACTCTPEQT